MLNVNTLSYLISAFRNTVNTFGNENKVVSYFRQQVESLVQIGQVGKAEADFIYRLLGMKNTDNIKWDITIKRLDSFVTAMNYMLSVENSTQARRDTLYDLSTEGIINNDVDAYIREVFGLRQRVTSHKLPDATVNFGDVSFNTKNVKVKPQTPTKEKYMSACMLVMSACTMVTLAVSVDYKSQSNRSISTRQSLNEMFTAVSTNECVKAIASGAKYEIMAQVVESDGCSSRFMTWKKFTSEHSPQAYELLARAFKMMPLQEMCKCLIEYGRPADIDGADY